MKKIWMMRELPPQLEEVADIHPPLLKQGEICLQYSRNAIAISYHDGIQVDRAFIADPDVALIPYLEIFNVDLFGGSLLFNSLRKCFGGYAQTLSGAEDLIKWINGNNGFGNGQILEVFTLYNSGPVPLAVDNKIDKDEPCSVNKKVRLLEELWGAIFYGKYHNFLRFQQLELIAITMGMYYGDLGQFKRADFYVNTTLRELPNSFSFSLKGASRALFLAQRGEVVPERLMKYIGRPSHFLESYVCDIPFRRFDIVETGEINLCCGHWLPQNVGRLENGTLDEILNSEIAQSIRKSVTDGSFQYCNVLECSKLAQPSSLIHKSNLSNYPEINKAITEQNFKVEKVDEILFAYDQSCNLACPSCRKEVITEKASENEEKARLVEEKVYPLLKNLKKINLNVAGEVFVSKPSRRILELISPQTTPDLKIDLISNGTLFNRNEWNKFPGIHTKVDSVRISLDGCTKKTFEKLRKNGRFEVLLDNLNFIKELRDSGVIKNLIFSFTYQVDNFREMEDFVNFALSYSVDRVIFEPLQNIGTFSNDEYAYFAVHKTGHSQYPEFLEIINQKIFSNNSQKILIQSDFKNYEGYQSKVLFLYAPLILDEDAQVLEGLIFFKNSSGISFMENEEKSRHRILINQSDQFFGSYNFEMQFRFVNLKSIGIELVGHFGHRNLILKFNLVDMSIQSQCSKKEGVDSISIENDSSGLYIIKFSTEFTQSEGFMFNIFYIGNEDEVIYKGRPSFGLRDISIAALKI